MSFLFDEQKSGELFCFEGQFQNLFHADVCLELSVELIIDAAVVAAIMGAAAHRVYGQKWVMRPLRRMSD